MGLISPIYGNNVYSLKSHKKKNRNKAKKIHNTILNQYQKELVARATPAEIAFQHLLVDMRIPFEFQKRFKRSNRKTAFADFYLPQLHMIVEIDGGYHNDPIQEWEDQQRTRAILKKNGRVKKVIRFTNDEVLNQIDAVRSKMLSCIYGYSSSCSHFTPEENFTTTQEGKK